MARIRTIKPEFFVSEQVADVSPTCRLLFVGMWLFCDDAGIHPASARQLKMEVFPGDAISVEDISGMVEELLRVGLLSEYSVQDGTQTKTYWQVTGWHHQKIERPRYQYPKPDSTTCRRRVVESSATPRSLTLPDPTVPETTGKEETTEEPRVRGVSYSQDFERWWAVYPKKVGKGSAAKAFKVARLKVDREELQQATERFAASPKSRGEFCWNPDTFLHQCHWTDDPAEWQEARGGNGRPGEPSAEDYQREAERRYAKTRAAAATAEYRRKQEQQQEDEQEDMT